MVHIDDKVKIEKIGLGTYHALALSLDGKVISWGAGISGQLGHGRVQKEVSQLVNEETSRLRASFDEQNSGGAQMSTANSAWAVPKEP
jgi:alpha-tubulin suppressor-like RCC1 family protein